jgi:hypothetical protein
VRHRQLKQTEALAEQAIALAAEQGFPEITRWTQTNLGWARAQLGQVEAGVKLIRKGISAAYASGARLQPPWIIRKRKRWVAREI